MGVRKIKPNAVSITGVHGISGEEFESSLEHKIIMLLAFDPYVLKVESQPVTTEYGSRSKYTPDLLIHFNPDAPPHPRRARPLLAEVKPTANYIRDFEKLRPKIKAAFHYARRKDYRFDVIREREIDPIYLGNVIFLRGFRLLEFPPDQLALVTQTIIDLKMTTPDEVLGSLTDSEELRGRYLPMIWQLVSTFVVLADLTIPLNQNAEIYYRKEDEDLCRLISSPVL